VDEAGRILFADPSGAAGAVRKAVEALLDDLGVRRKRRVAKGKTYRYQRMSLDARILDLEQSKPDVAPLLRAIKWIGNVGAHESELSVTDVLDGAEILSVAIELIFDDSRDAAAKLAADITKRKGRPSNSKTRTAR
jgi:hypothetical protein